MYETIVSQMIKISLDVIAFYRVRRIPKKNNPISNKPFQYGIAVRLGAAGIDNNYVLIN